MNLVYTHAWVEDLRQRYGSSPDHARPRLYHLWTAEQCRNARDRVERWVAALPSEQQQKVIPRLRDGKQFRQTFNELAVGASLRGPGRALEYEPNLDGLTPDWLISHSGTELRFIVEVVSSNQSEARERCENQWEEFRLRLQDLPGDAYLYLEPPLSEDDDVLIASPPAPRQRQIVHEVGQWLRTGPEVGATRRFDAVTIHYLGYATERGVCCDCSGLPFVVNGEPLRDAVKEKAKKYRGVITQRQLPFVVCVVPDFGTGRGIYDLQDAVFGTPRCRLIGNARSGYRQEHYRERNGLFLRYTTLSAVTIATPTVDGLTHSLLRNPKAIYPLEEGAVGHEGRTRQETQLETE